MIKTLAMLIVRLILKKVIVMTCHCKLVTLSIGNTHMAQIPG